MKGKINREIEDLKNNLNKNEEKYTEEILELKKIVQELELKSKLKDKKSFNINNSVK